VLDNALICRADDSRIVEDSRVKVDRWTDGGSSGYCMRRVRYALDNNNQNTEELWRGRYD
jgi:hypothetical protein